MEAFFFLVCGFSCVVCLAIAWLVTRKKHREPPRAAAAAAAEPVWCALGTAPPIAIEKLFKVAENGFKVRLSRGPAAVAARRGGVLDRCRALNRALDLDCYDPTGSAARLWGVSRARPFASAAGAILEATRSELVVGADVRFEGEAGYDAGGVVRDWCSGAAAEIVGTAGMLRPLSDGTLMLAPPPPKDGASWLDDADGGRAASLGDPAALEVDLGDYRCSPTKGPLTMSVAKAKRLEFSMSRPERLARVMAFGRLAGAVLAWSARSLAATMGEADEGAAPTLGVPLARALAKLVVGDDIDASDVRALDPELYESRIGVVTRPGGIDALRAALGLGDDPLTFSWFDLKDGARREPLHAGGGDEVVTPANAERYVRETAERLLLGAVRREAEAFLVGVESVLGDRRKLLDADDVLLLLAGLGDVDVGALRKHAAAAPPDGAPPRAAALLDDLFDVLEASDGEDRARFLLFVTGYARLPPGGFDRVKPRLTIAVDLAADVAHLPVAHTCQNHLALPLYPTRAVLEAKLAVALAHGAHFGLR